MKFNLFVTGCYYNYEEANKITQLLNQMGYLYTSDENKADYIFVIACSVRQKPIDRIYGKLKKWSKSPLKPKIVVSACILPKDKKTLEKKVYAIIDSKNLEKEIKANIPDLKSNIEQKHFFHPKDIKNKTSFIPIMQGCNNFCTYCAVPFTRGHEISLEPKTIIKNIKQELNKKYKHIILLGQNVNSYHPKDKTTFAQLLQKIDKINFNFTYNFTSPNPRNFSEELIKTLPKLKKWQHRLHIPLQSGNNDILKKMNRKYQVDEFNKIIKKLKTVIPDIIFTTDIIVGFPGETKRQFQDTYELCKKIDFEQVFVAQYSPRPGTYAEKNFKDNISVSEKKRRWKKINDLINKKVCS